jgi:serine/threonine-protein kinase
VQTFDHGFTADGIPYIVMELLEGRDLGAFLDAEGKASPELVVEIVAQLARALDRAHERGIVHRDIKPGNIFLCDSGGGDVFIKLLDFGIAKGVDVPVLDSGTKTGAMIGSPFYMSPEQILGSKNIDHRSDLWSVGVVAYEALTGEKPFDAETMGGLAIRIHSEPLPLVTKTLPGIAPAVDAWFQRACARPVPDRFNSAKEMAETLAAALGGQMPRSVGVPKSSTGSNSQRDLAAHEPTLASTDAGLSHSTPAPSTRNRLIALVGVGAVLMAGAFFGVSYLKKKGEITGGNGPALTSEPAPPVAPSTLSMTPPPPSPQPQTSLSPIPAPAPDPQTAAGQPSPGPGQRPGHNHPRPGTSSASPPAHPPLPSPGPAAPAPAPAPAPTGHDIF